MGAISAVSKRIMKALTASPLAGKDFTAFKHVSLEDFNPYIKSGAVIKAQERDILSDIGKSMSPEQTNKALNTLRDLAPTEESLARRNNFIDQLTKSGILEDPSISKVYAAGSIATPKDKVKDLDLLLRADYDKMPAKLGYKLRDIDDDLMLSRGDIDLLTTTTKDFERISRGEQVDAVSDTRIGALHRYGPKYRWIRLKGIAPAIPGGGWPLYREQE